MGHQTSRGVSGQGGPRPEASKADEQHGATAQEGAGAGEQHHGEQHEEQKGGGEEHHHHEQEHSQAGGGKQKDSVSSAEGCEKVAEGDMPAPSGGEGLSAHLSKVGRTSISQMCTLCFLGGCL